MPPGAKKKNKRDKNKLERRDSGRVEHCKGHNGKGVHVNQLRKVLQQQGSKPWTCVICKKEKIEKPEIENECQICLKCGAPFCCNEDRDAHLQTAHSDPHTLFFYISNKTIWCTQCNQILTKDSGKKIFNILGDSFINSCSNISITCYKAEKINNASVNFYKETYKGSNNAPAMPIIGLINCGNSCYANSVLQCLAQTPGLYESIKEELGGPKSITLKNGEILEINSILPDDIIHDYLGIHSYLNKADHRQTKISASNLLKQLQYKAQHFDWREQHDAHEFLRLLLDLLKTPIHEQYKTKSKNMNDKKSRRSISPQKTLYSAICEVKNFGPDKIFGGKIVNKLMCKVCKLETERSEVFMDISLPVIKQDSDNTPVLSEKTVSKIPQYDMKKIRRKKSKNSYNADKTFTKEDVTVENNKNLETLSNENISKIDTECYEDQVVPSLGENELFDEVNETLKCITLGLSEDEDKLPSDADDDIPELETIGFDDTTYFPSQNQLILEEGKLNGGSENLVGANEKIEEFPGNNKKKLMKDINGNIYNRLLDENQNMMTVPSRCGKIKQINYLSQALTKDFGDDETNSSIWIKTIPSAFDSWISTYSLNSDKKSYCHNTSCPNYKNEVQKLIFHSTDEKSFDASRIVLNFGNSMRVTKEIGIHNVKPETYFSPYSEKDETAGTLNHLNTIEEESHERNFGPSNSPVSDDFQITPLFDEISNLPPLTDEETKIINDCEMEYKFDSSSSIYSCLKQFVDLEHLTGSNKVACDNCTKCSIDSKAVYTDRVKTLTIIKAPEALILHLKRFQLLKGDVKKVKKHVRFTTILDFTPFCMKDNDNKKLYRLYGVVEHSGTISSGHYVCYVAKFEDDLVTSESNAQWYYASDSCVTPVTEDRVLQTQAYLLFYRKILD